MLVVVLAEESVAAAAAETEADAGLGLVVYEPAQYLPVVVELGWQLVLLERLELVVLEWRRFASFVELEALVLSQECE